WSHDSSRVAVKVVAGDGCMACPVELNGVAVNWRATVVLLDAGKLISRDNRTVGAAGDLYTIGTTCGGARIAGSRKKVIGDDNTVWYGVASIVAMYSQSSLVAGLAEITEHAGINK